ncbi:daptide biosynthesis RiPP recognition protein [Kitasatospora sp. NPDC101155]|uniref:daptide biosynthesis RiPP recognition protein n=1 Tax=Kitasatospora sp. NPDC101155 TaxID=3364097 RepID=UPI0037F58330
MSVRAGARMVAAGLAQWASGRRTDLSGRVFFLESAEHLAAVLRFATADDLVIAPEDGLESDSGSAAVARYSGRFVEPGDEMLVEGRYAVELQDYLAAAFLPVVGFTVVRLDGEAGWRTYLEDAELARDTGAFVEQLVHPAVLLADKGALGRDATDGRSLPRIHVTESGEVRTAPGGTRLGTVDDSFDELILAASRLSADGEDDLRAVVAPEDLRATLAERPWLPRYVHALEALRVVRQEGADWRVSGFGGRLVDGLPAEYREPDEAPLLLWNDTDHLLHHPRSGRRFRLGADAARLAELLLVTGSAEAAAALGAELLGLAEPVARQAAAEVEARLERAGLWVPAVGAAR